MPIVYIEYQVLFTGKNIINVSSAEYAQRDWTHVNSFIIHDRRLIPIFTI